MNGYLLLYKKIEDSDIWHKPAIYLKVFIYLLIHAQYQDYGDLKRGQLRTSVTEIQEACSYFIGYRKVRPERSEIERVLKYLRRPHERRDERHAKAGMKAETNAEANAGMITTAKAGKGIIVTICNYNIYQEFNSCESRDKIHNESRDESRDESRHEDFTKAETKDSYIIKEINNKEIINNNNNNARARAKKFIPPTVEEVREFCLQRNNGLDAEKFFNYYESNGWHVGKNKMKDWHAAIRTWERNQGGKGVGKRNGNDDRFSGINVTEF